MRRLRLLHVEHLINLQHAEHPTNLQHVEHPINLQHAEHPTNLQHAEHLTNLQRAAVHAVLGTNSFMIVHRIPGGLFCREFIVVNASEIICRWQVLSVNVKIIVIIRKAILIDKEREA
jgi:hypothetical protein